MYLLVSSMRNEKNFVGQGKHVHMTISIRSSYTLCCCTVAEEESFQIPLSSLYQRGGGSFWVPSNLLPHVVLLREFFLAWVASGLLVNDWNRNQHAGFCNAALCELTPDPFRLDYFALNVADAFFLLPWILMTTDMARKRRTELLNV